MANQVLYICYQSFDCSPFPLDTEPCTGKYTGLRDVLTITKGPLAKGVFEIMEIKIE